MTSSFRIAAAVACCLLAASTQAGTVLVSESRSGNTVTTSEIRAQGANLRVDNTSSGDRSSFIMAGKTMYTINHGARTYMELDEASMRQLGGQMAQMRAQMDAQMANLPPEQQAMVRQMMAGNAGARPAAPRTAYRRTARTETAAGIACKVWEGITAGKKTAEICVAAAGAIPGGNELLASMRQMGANMSKMTEAMGINMQSRMQDAWSQVDAVGGVPIISREFEGTRVTSSNVLKVIRAENAAPASFMPPPGYRKEQMSMGGR